MSALRTLFITPVCQERFADEDEPLLAELEAACLGLARDDRAGRAWCKTNGYGGYTSYASLNDLPRRDPAFAELKRRLDRHAAHFAEALRAHVTLQPRPGEVVLWESWLRHEAPVNRAKSPRISVSFNYA